MTTQHAIVVQDGKQVVRVIAMRCVGMGRLLGGRNVMGHLGVIMTIAYVFKIIPCYSVVAVKIIRNNQFLMIFKEVILHDLELFAICSDYFLKTVGYILDSLFLLQFICILLIHISCGRTKDNGYNHE